MRSRRRKRRAIQEVKQAVQASVNEEVRRCACGKLLQYSGDYCEECWVSRQLRWHGHDQSVKVKL
jgi:hypothetical protein